MAVNVSRGNEHNASHHSANGVRLLLFVSSIFLLPTALAAAQTPTVAPSDAAGTPSVIVFTPSAVMLNNPASPGTRSASSTFTVDLTAYDSKGNLLTPTPDHPLHVHVYGAPDGVISPVDTQLTTATPVQFRYSGEFFPNNLELAAWIDNPSGGAALGTTLLVQQNRPACTGSRKFDLAMVSNVPDEIKVKAVVGADHPQGNFATFTMDTGSLGVIVTKSDLVLGPNVHGPGAAGQKYYDSSGYIFTGRYYLAPVSLQLSDNSYLQTNPILVLAIDGAKCDASHPGCKRPKPDLHYLGVGFNRNSSRPGDLFDSPSENASLQLTDASKGTDINQGYILSKDGVTLGITEAGSRGFKMVTLYPNTVAGDWLPEQGCYQFTSLEGSPQFCGNLLLDVGIAEMFLDLSFDKRPAGSYDSTNKVPCGVGMNIQAGLTGDPAMSYNFTAVQPPELPTGPAPTYVRWDDDKNVFVNTGRRALLNFDYLYSGQCGEVGFRPVQN